MILIMNYIILPFVVRCSYEKTIAINIALLFDTNGNFV